MPLHTQNDPDLDTIADLQRSITATLSYIMGLASVAELFGLQGYLSKLASQMTPPDAGNPRLPPMPHQGLPPLPAVLSQQLAEMERQQTQMRAMQEQGNRTAAQYRQET